MKKLKNYDQFVKESFTLTLDQLPIIGDIVDKVNWKEGENAIMLFNVPSNEVYVRKLNVKIPVVV